MEKIWGRVSQVSFGLVAAASALMIIGFFQLLEVFIRFGQGAGFDQNLLFSGATLLPWSLLLLIAGTILVTISFGIWEVYALKKAEPRPLGVLRLILSWLPPLFIIAPLINLEKIWNTRHKNQISGLLLLRTWWASIVLYTGLFVLAIILQIEHIPSLQMLLSLFALASMALLISSLLGIAVIQSFLSAPVLPD